MKPYPKYKPSGVAWFDKVPEQWDVWKLKRFAKICNGQDQKNIADENGVYPIIGSGGVFGKTSEYLHTGPSVLLGRKGTIDRPQFISSPFWSIDTAYFTDIYSYTNPRFFYYSCLTINFDLYKYGSAVPSMTQEVLNQIPFAHPPLEEQNAIARFLDDKTAKIDKLIEKKRRLIELLKEERQAVINHAVTKGMNPNAKMKPSGIEWLGDVPEGWEVVGMTKYLESIVDYRGRTPEKVESGVFLVTARNVKGGAIDYTLSEEFVTHEEYERYMTRGLPRIGDVLFTTEAPLGEAANVDREDIALAQRIIKFRGLPNVLDNYFVKFSILSNSFQFQIQSNATGSTALGIKASKLNQLQILLPPISEQRQIAAFLDQKTDEIDTLISNAERAISLLTEYRTALITEAVTGKVEVGNN